MQPAKMESIAPSSRNTPVRWWSTTRPATSAIVKENTSPKTSVVCVRRGLHAILSPAMAGFSRAASERSSSLLPLRSWSCCRSARAMASSEQAPKLTRMRPI